MYLNRCEIPASFAGVLRRLQARVRGAGAFRTTVLGFALAMCWGLQQAQSQVVPEQLRILVTQGEGDPHRPGDKIGTTIVVQVLNELDLPQSEADVTFTSDLEGPGVLLEGDRTDFMLSSDAQGMARINGVMGNNIKGAVTITVRAAFEGKTGSIKVNQMNVSGTFWTRKRFAILGTALATTGIILYQVLKPGPPTATINPPTATTGR